jgi:limonene-1,2-epoxide hydrolase
MSYFAPDAVWDNVPIALTSGYDEIRKEVERWVRPLTSFDAEILNLAVAGNIVLLERVDHATVQGRSSATRTMGAFEVDGDKIKVWRDCYDVSKEAAAIIDESFRQED